MQWDPVYNNMDNNNNNNMDTTCHNNNNMDTTGHNNNNMDTTGHNNNNMGRSHCHNNNNMDTTSGRTSMGRSWMFSVGRMGNVHKDLRWRYEVQSLYWRIREG